MTIALAHITFDAVEPGALAAFWSAALGRPVDEGASEHFASIDDADPGRPSWFFVKVPEGKLTKNRLHVDLTADDRDAEVERLIGIGATKLSQHDEWGASWTVLVDPENNEFCVGEKPAGESSTGPPHRTTIWTAAPVLPHSSEPHQDVAGHATGLEARTSSF